MEKYTNSVTLDKDLCKGCTNCIKRCPTEAIRVRNGKADIQLDRCIDCAECIRLCPHNAKKPIYDKLDKLQDYKYTVALPAPALYGQFNNVEDVGQMLGALKNLGFDDIFEVSRAAELVSDATRKLLATNSLRRPAISTACPAVLRLIRMRYPTLIDNLLPLVAPVELAARLARAQAVKKTGLAPEDIGTFFISPCPAKVTAAKSPVGNAVSEISGVLAIKDIYPLMLVQLSLPIEPFKTESGRIGVSWAGTSGESAGLVTYDNYLAADGMENVIRVLEDIEGDRIVQLDFIELNSCSGGCVGGVLAVENPYHATTKIKQLRRYLPVQKNNIEGSIPINMLWDKDLSYNPALEIGENVPQTLERFAELERINSLLPGLDCGSCGAPSCRALAEDCVKGLATTDDCIVRIKERLEDMLAQRTEAGPLLKENAENAQPENLLKEHAENAHNDHTETTPH